MSRVGCEIEGQTHATDMLPLTSTLLGSVEPQRSGIAAGVLNATRQTGSVLGVALFGSLASQSSAFIGGRSPARH